MVSRLWRALACAVLWLAAIMSAMPASAPTDDWHTCADEWPDFAIEACTRAINSGKYKDHDLAVLYVNRGLAYEDVADLDRAMADFTVRLDPNFLRSGARRHGGEPNPNIYDVRPF